MKDVKVPTSRSYDEYFINALQNTERAAGYIEAILEEKEPGFELLAAAIKDVIDARLLMNNLSEEAKLSWGKLEKMLSASGGAEIYALVNLLDALGFCFSVTEKPTDS
jgi:DNA-binding phage protein